MSSRNDPRPRDENKPHFSYDQAPVQHGISTSISASSAESGGNSNSVARAQVPPSPYRSGNPQADYIWHHHQNPPPFAPTNWDRRSFYHRNHSHPSPWGFNGPDSPSHPNQYQPDRIFRQGQHHSFEEYLPEPFRPPPPPLPPHYPYIAPLSERQAEHPRMGPSPTPPPMPPPMSFPQEPEQATLPIHQSGQPLEDTDRAHAQAPSADGSFSDEAEDEDYIWDVRPSDILCGRGAPTNHHRGNLEFRDLVKEYQTLYLCSKRSEKPGIAVELMQIVQSRNGRFLRRVKTSGTGRKRFAYVQIGEQRTYEKVCQALREGAPELRRQMISKMKRNKGGPSKSPDRGGDKENMPGNSSRPRDGGGGGGYGPHSHPGFGGW